MPGASSLSQFRWSMRSVKAIKARKTSLKGTPLVGDLQKLSALLARGDEGLKEALHGACAEGQEQAVQALLKAKAQVRTRGTAAGSHRCTWQPSVGTSRWCGYFALPKLMSRRSMRRAGRHSTWLQPSVAKQMWPGSC
ncbi:unnamed protein product [Effrenium voratum]|uniref:Uncharacterized protein n=1 Tax=Effrenium voratum TaxID=2562239 RepID=A0AA36J4U7_9DINO|nr:unnamed protein product [Effrenium voratum]